MLRLITVTTLFVLFTMSSVTAQTGIYIGAAGGAAYFLDQSADVDFGGIEDGADVDFEYDTTYQIAGRVGYRAATNIRLEAEVAYASADTDRVFSFDGDISVTEQELSVTSLTGSVFFELWPIGVLAPYVGAGLGYARVEATSDIGEDVEQNVLTVLGEIGVPYYVVPSVSIVPSLRFSWYLTEEEQAAGVTRIGDNLYNTQLQLGLNYHF